VETRPSSPNHHSPPSASEPLAIRDDFGIGDLCAGPIRQDGERAAGDTDAGRD
jgi:hypothetical protein